MAHFYPKKILSFLLLMITYFCYCQKGQVANVDESVLAMSDRTYLSFGQGIGSYKTLYGVKRLTPIIFEGQISPDFLLNLSKQRTMGIAVFPKILVRMYNENSVPVKTPSYMPSALFYHRVKLPSSKNSKLLNSQNQIAFMTYRVLHHSNGQDGSYYIAGTDSVNYTNGNFSTNALEIAFSWSAIDSGAMGKSFMNGRIAYERQLDFEREAALKDRYYYNKATVESHFIYSEKIKTYITYSFMWGTKTFGTKHSIDIFLLGKPFQKLTDFSVFIRGYVGPDYYNLYYSNILRAITFGIIADPLSIPVFKKRKNY